MQKINPAEIAVSKEVENNAGGLAFRIEKWERLDRYLIIGAESGTYYASPRKNISENVNNVLACIAEDGKRVVARTIEVSEEGLAPKNDQAIFVLALCAAKGDPETKALVKADLNLVCRTASHLTMFVERINTLKEHKWGRCLRSTVANWYTESGGNNNIGFLVYQLMKYANRNGFTQRDILRLCHAKPKNELQSTIFDWIVHPEKLPKLPNSENLDKLMALSEDLYKYAVAKQLSNYNIESVIDLILKYNLPHEVIPTNMRNEPKVWQALLDAGMPIHALIRNLGKFSQLGLLQPLSANAKKVIDTFTDEKHVRRARIHPINVLNQMRGYASGRGKSGISWLPNDSVRAAMEDMFYLSFKNVEPTGKNIMLALDISSSMTWGPVEGMELTSAEISAAMLMTTLRTEKNSYAYGFSTSFEPLDITKNDSLDVVMRKVYDRSFGGTDCALPMFFAKKENLDVDAFIIYTDSETWAGGRYTPVKALRDYRASSGKENAKLAVVACTSSGFTINDPNDPNGLDVAGFSSAVPQVLSYFISK